MISQGTDNGLTFRMTHLTWSVRVLVHRSLPASFLYDVVSALICMVLKHVN